MVAVGWTAGDAVGAVLVYHRVAERSSDPLRLNVTPQRLAQHLEVLRTDYRPAPLAELTDALVDGGLVDRSVAVTFDDGYAGVLHWAQPLLENAMIPATAFITAGFLGGDREFWWEELDSLLPSDGAVPPTLEIEAAGTRFSWKEPGRLRRRLRRTSRRLQLYVELFRAVRRLDPADRRFFLDEIAAATGLERTLRPDHRPLTPAELRELGSQSLIEIGAHTVSHPVLSTLSASEQRDEIVRSKELLEELLGQRVESFAYPHGGPLDYTHESVLAARQAGFARACANVPALVRDGVDPFQLPRFIVGDWDGETFAHRLEAWFAR
jgi:peptidoglycan/xylan/chitin deacetylase (PgdA/CDA1 family)